MIFIENLDHNPQAVTLEKLPDGTAWLYLRKDAHEVRTEAPEGEQGGTCLLYTSDAADDATAV